MCFAPDEPNVPNPAPPPEVLKQAAPTKKTATPANALAIGSKKYRTASGIGTAGLGANVAPTGIGLN